MGTERLPPGAGFVLEPVLATAPDREAVVASDRRLTYAGLDTAADLAAAGLIRRGLRRGDRLAVSLPNTSDIVVLFHAAMRLGAIWVGLNMNLAAPEKSYILHDSDARLLITRSDAADELSRAGVRTEVSLLLPEEVCHSSAPATDYPRPEDLFDSPAGIAYTSGTTGRPKGVVHSQGNLLLPGAVLVEARGFDSSLRRGDSAALTILNLQVTSTLLAAQAGGAQVVMDRVDPRGIAWWIRTEQVTSWFGVPTTLYGLARDAEVAAQDLASLEDIWTGGADLPEVIRAEFETKFNRRVYATYGLTEVPTVVTIEPRHQAHRAGSSGRVLPHLRVGILADGVPVDPGREGEIVISGRSDGEWGDSYHPMLGYHHQPDDSVESLRDGLLYTGDVGILDDDANLTVCGRQRSLILRGGANVYPAEVERVVLEFPGVVGVAVVGMADERLGQRVGAAVEIAPGAQVHEVDLEAHCRSCLARYKVPERWLFRALPRNAMGKVTTSDVESWFADPTP